MLISFLTGLLGSLHCLGMCGPLALALPAEGRLRGRFVTGRVLYNLGRVLTYAVLGGLVALVGTAAALFDAQRYVSLALGGLMLVLAMREMGWLRWGKGGRQLAKPGRYLTGLLAKRLQKRGPGAMLVFGMLNGLLPCGMVYIGLFQAALAASPWEGMARMALFGMGTWPVMLTVSLSGQWLLKALGGRFRIMPPLMAGVGLMLLLRGMALGIPYLSPKMNMSPSGPASLSCHVPAEPLHVDTRIEAVAAGKRIPICE